MSLGRHLENGEVVFQKLEQQASGPGFQAFLLFGIDIFGQLEDGPCENHGTNALGVVCEQVQFLNQGIGQAQAGAPFVVAVVEASGIVEQVFIIGRKMVVANPAVEGNLVGDANLVLKENPVALGIQAHMAQQHGTEIVVHVEVGAVANFDVLAPGEERMFHAEQWDRQLVGGFRGPVPWLAREKETVVLGFPLVGPVVAFEVQKAVFACFQRELHAEIGLLGFSLPVELQRLFGVPCRNRPEASRRENRFRSWSR